MPDDPKKTGTDEPESSNVPKADAEGSREDIVDAGDDADGEEDDEEEEDEEEELPVVRSRPHSRPGMGPAVDVPRTEAALNTPDRQTVWMLIAVSLATIIMWGASRAACNAHPPRETRRPRAVTLDELSRDPKGAAIELQQSLAVHDFKAARKLAAGGLVKQVDSEQQACKANEAQCAPTEELKSEVFTMGSLLARTPAEAIVRVRTEGPKGDGKPYIVHLQREGRTWKATERVPDEGSSIAKLEERYLNPAEAADAGAPDDASSDAATETNAPTGQEKTESE